MEEQPSKKPRVEDQTGGNVKVENDGEESDEEIFEVGPDGLRLIEDCVGALMEEDEATEGVLNCKLCVLVDPPFFYSHKTTKFYQHTGLGTIWAIRQTHHNHL
jgi:hypothetical protein